MKNSIPHEIRILSCKLLCLARPDLSQSCGTALAYVAIGIAALQLLEHANYARDGSFFLRCRSGFWGQCQGRRLGSRPTALGCLVTQSSHKQIDGLHAHTGIVVTLERVEQHLAHIVLRSRVAERLQ